MANIAPTDFGSAIVAAIQEYTDGVAAGIAAEIDSTAKAVRKEIAANAPEDKGEYKRGWAVKKADTPGRTRRIVHNKKKPGLVHLLENGHALQDGGRARAFPHVAPVCNRRMPEMLENIKRVIKNGGGK